MALVSNVGLGSGLDISSLVRQLVDAERAAPSAALNRVEARTKAEISALGQVRSAFSQLQAAVNRLRSGDGFDGRKVTSADTDRLTASIRSDATPALANYQIEIESLASAQKLQSDPTVVTAADAAVGAGTLQFTVDGETIDVEVAADDSIYDLAASINEGADGKLQASVIRGDDGYSLSITSGVSGSAGSVEIAQTAGGTSLAAFTFDPDAPGTGLTQTAAATDAVLYIDGVRLTTSSNTVTDAIDGLELVLKQAEVGTSFTLTVGEDSTGAQQAVEAFVSAYNKTLDVLAKVSAFDLEAKTAEPLNGDSFIRSAVAQLRGFVGDALGSAGDAGIRSGFDTQVDGKLKFNSVDFLNTLQSNPDALKAVFSGEDAALTTGLSAYVDGLIGAQGALVLRTDSLNNTLKRVDSDRATLDRRMVAIEERYRRQFVALDGLLGRLNSTSQYLAQQLAGLPGA